MTFRGKWKRAIILLQCKPEIRLIRSVLFLGSSTLILYDSSALERQNHLLFMNQRYRNSAMALLKFNRDLSIITIMVLCGIMMLMIDASNFTGSRLMYSGNAIAFFLFIKS